MSTDPHHRVPAIVLEPLEDPPEVTDGDRYRELVAAHNMQQNLLAIELRHIHATVVKQSQSQERHHERSRAHLVEIRDAQRDLAKPDPVQQAILDELRGMREMFKDMTELVTTLVAMKTNGHGSEH